jgi:DNA-binding response OmpR family regulator
MAQHHLVQTQWGTGGWNKGIGHGRILAEVRRLQNFTGRAHRSWLYTRAMNPLLMIEDDVRLSQMVTDYLTQSGYAVEQSGNAQHGLARLQSEPAPALVILDLMLPDMDGLEVCRRIRQLPGEEAHTPVLMLTAKGDPMDRVLGLEIGADDYLTKPFEPRELLARIRAIQRRQELARGRTGVSNAPVMRFGSLEIDRDARSVSVSGLACELTSYQFDLLTVMAERAGRVLTREQIMEAVRGRELEAFDRSIDVHVGRIRAAIEHDVKDPKRILTVRGVGYVFARQQH